MQAKKTILLTFDYELFLGSRSGTVKNCVILPTQKLISIFEKYKITKTIFFVDTTYLVRLKNSTDPKCKEDLKKISEQLRQLSDMGHYIYPHLHPHWLDAIYLPDLNQWDLTNTSKYNLAVLTENERAILFSESMKILEEIRGKYQDSGYRAGGWCIQPFANFKPFFEKENIRYDFSVMKGYCCRAGFQYFDFRQAPGKAFYKFKDYAIAEDKNGPFTEVTISTLKIRYVNRLLSKLFTKLLYKRGVSNYGDGISTESASLKEIKPIGYEMASLELLTIVNMNDYLKAIDERDYIQFISHPKMLSPHNLNCLEILLKQVTEKYEVNTDFKEILNQAEVSV